MTHHQKPPLPIVKHPAHRRAILRLDEVLERASRRKNAAQALAEHEQLTRARIELFGCAPQ